LQKGAFRQVLEIMYVQQVIDILIGFT